MISSTCNANRKPNAIRAKGFTLLEVLIALAILATGLMALSTSILNSTKGQTRQIERTFAHYVANNQLGEMKVEDAWPELGTTRGNIEMFNREWTWKQVVTKTTVDSLRRVDVSVTIKDDEEYNLATLTAFVGRPPEKDPRR